MDVPRTTPQEQDTPILLRWLIDETFFSLCSRYHLFSGNFSPSTTSNQLVSSTELGIKHDFPFNLDTLKSNGFAAWGNSESIIAGHTILPLFSPFQSESNIQAAIASMKSSKLGSIKYRLGLLTGRFGAEHPLKACTTCMRYDFATHGVSYWHLAHQYPGVIVCPVHHQLLRECIHNRRWSGRFLWTLPSEEELSPSPEIEPYSATQAALLQLATAVLDLAAIGFSRTFDPQLVSSVYCGALNRFGKSNAALKSAAASLSEHTALLQSYHPLTHLPSTAEGAAPFIEQFTRSPRGHFHPLKHLVMITWLFDNLGSFMDAYEQVEFQEHLRPLVKVAGASRMLPALGRAEPHTVAHVPKARPRPKKLKPSVRSAVLELLAGGALKSDICLRFNITISTVNKLLRAEPLAQRAWAEARHHQTLLQHRNGWSALIAQAPDLSTKALRGHSPGTYAWLYRNDKAWLLSQTTQLPAARQGNHSKIDWLARDRDLEQLVRRSLIDKFGSDRDLHLSRSQIYALVPILPTCLEKRSRYEGTRAFLLGV
ncbi:TnsD family Tn7-like transposition protein [Pseudomonas fluorescens]|uniref:TnsD family Tn7-like transposition protein n=1 Tax=Pseudomonas fluorescens TaxID=294 RepID=UPI001249AC87|nr:TnsD family Tn7-like transposition protein [Pseudomonas fluorescens]CAG8870737.1 hypothetical protein PS861_03673 [Pseudomonas fluorescens]